LFPVSAPSHAAVNFALVKELARRGHQVTVLSPFPQKKHIPNYFDIAIEKIQFETLLNMSGE
jgi:glucuronosyltransferase